MSGEKYHPYVFDLEKRRFVGAFEEMYQAEAKEDFDSWHQDDDRSPHRGILRSLATWVNYSRLVDLGCGKGSLTSSFKTSNTKVYGIDIAPTAVAIASERYPDINFLTADLNDVETVAGLIDSLPKSDGPTLVLCAELLSYLSNWEDIIAALGTRTDYLLISLFIPENPIGFVKSPEALSEMVEKHFHILEELHMKVERFRIILAKRKSNE